ncbi:MAG TPA: DinB family protein, partial [Candidatus Angelobacter sp.]|nr:DinB family protein [Candidatus Angelobacter sp.]
MSSNTNPALQEVPTDLQAVLRDLERADDEARQLVNSLSDQQLNWQPGGGTGWSVAQCLDHMTQVNCLYATA